VVGSPLWFVATSVSGVVGWAVAVLVSIFLFPPALAGVMTIACICVGTAQWFVLWPYTWNSNRLWAMARWVALSAVGGTIAWWTIILIGNLAAIVNEKIHLHPLYALFVFFVGGGIFGLAQWLTWGVGQVWSLAWWALVNAFGWSAGGFVGVQVGRAVFTSLFPNHLESIMLGWEEGVHFFVAGAVAIPIYALFTAVGLLVVLWKLDLPRGKERT